MTQRHLGTVVAGASIAVTVGAALVAVTLPGAASGDSPRDPAYGHARYEQVRYGPGAAQGSAAGGDGAPPPGVVEPPPPRVAAGGGTDPLTDDEIGRARALALSADPREAGEGVRGAPGPQPLSVDLAEVPPKEAGAAAPPRRAQVSSYDYRRDAYVTTTVDLASGRVVRTDTQRGVQPPPSRQEAVEAARLLIGDRRLGEGLRRDYRDATGRELTDPAQLTVTGFVYRVDAENPGPARLGACGRHRCVRLFSRVRNGPWIDTRWFVVDLSARSVSRLD
ncbi:Tat pathway signal sequence domain protein [Streptomyces sp. LX-29]|uniref:Tat pathway signal sequence domain protein n=1 Tax=Streptomyces sp. LX-29 TaxID=2900152 RepID=UPI00240E4FEF|nr:Tat pathway signal sequence domain protein [Streptomyces sp. LX-29]WFB11517.1 Tat pathway signal sequence domain protein [Streptomyces sp. LX-29]